MAEVTALGFEYADRTGNTLDGLTAAREIGDGTIAEQ